MKSQKMGVSVLLFESSNQMENYLLSEPNATSTFKMPKDVRKAKHGARTVHISMWYVPVCAECTSWPGMALENHRTEQGFYRFLYVFLLVSRKTT